MSIRPVYSVWCDADCGQWAGRDSDKKRLVRAVRAAGWQVTQRTAYCPQHLRKDGVAELSCRVERGLSAAGVKWEERSDYSGRGMDGQFSPLAVVVDQLDSSSVYKVLTDLGLSCDSMGKKSIYYSTVKRGVR